ncbi:MAG TPA: CvpA family protein, partial [Verrucomicrobiae bacterium]
MTIWILAILVMALTALAGWRQGGIRAGIAFVGIIFATLLCGLVGKIFHAILPSLGASNPVTAWALAPICGFIVISIIFAVIAFNVHRKVDHFYRYNAGELRLALWERLNSRLGICIGLLNGAIYFTLISFFLFNLTYWTTQISAGAKQTSFMVKMLNNAGEGMQATGFSKAAAGVHTLQPNFYKFADLAGLLTQNPQTAQRFVHYPALTSLWESSDMQSLVNDATLTNALASGA